MKVISKLHFGTAGIPLSTPKKTSADGVKRVKELGLDAMELEFVRGVRMSRASASEIRAIASELGVVLTAHAPYYINLNSRDQAKLMASIERLLDSARIGSEAGAFSVVFHPAYYGGETPQNTYNRVRDALRYVVKRLRDEGIEIWIRPETMGGLAEFGELEEVISLSEELEMVLPAIDFAHLHARSLGKYNTYEEIADVLRKIEQRLGREALDSMHIHISGIEYGNRGEIKHLNLEESDLNYTEILKALKDFKVKGVVISESPNIEEDAILMKKRYETM
ncbi:MAG: TIM barrel protein [Desulfurococcales archaeon]|jgi:deoxyribonuclease-4|nr:TIM barrel protein [Desulfurococcales archaeon]